eukprot:1701284-Amphidinium_carterae.1
MQVLQSRAYVTTCPPEHLYAPEQNLVCVLVVCSWDLAAARLPPGGTTKSCTCCRGLWSWT